MIFKKIRNAFVGTATPYYVEDGNFYLESNNVKDGSINRKTEIFINNDFYEKQKDKWLHTDDIVMVQSGHVGHTAVIPEELNNTAAHAVIMFQGYQQQTDPQFLNFQFQTGKAKKELSSITTGNTIKHILASEMKKFKVSVPQYEEQNKVGDFFKELDNAIALHQLRESKLTKLKKAYIQKLFPITENESPVIRFKEFNYNWDLCKLQEISNITMGQSPKGETYTNNPEEHILIQGNADMKNRKVVPRVWTSQVTKSANPGDIILSVRAPVGEVGITDYEVVLGRGVASLTGNEFLFQSLLRMKETGYWTKYSTGSTFESINSADLKNAEIYQPHMDEQIQIGELLETFDNLIGLQADKVNKLKDLKKGYLQKSFL
ncbi:Type I restriction-modification system, specificity subunit S [Marinilactibacillus psychrotolerans 42ea]|uniref:Type I restriction-modification system, specificity subunit S n=1 Tax=Marinilactibacillus psychrotolerans 42ea TaxID=1255609 RepID=A0A1R4IGP5_9LACT|nr:restriction endonuclease subunit S [Marinilactibacillus psychrotolerans]SJN18980.1 Type I restriction-modification system, specificity subunit S [Marinilactibacillus psychrotolerans 42ea]